MRIRFLLLAVGCWLSAVSAQWLETKIILPDSLGGLTDLSCVLYNSVNHDIYVGGNSGNCVIAIDGGTNRKFARIPTPSAVSALCGNPVDNKVYSANSGSGDVTVIDGANNWVRATVSVDSGPAALCHNHVDNKLYCANGRGQTHLLQFRQPEKA